MLRRSTVDPGRYWVYRTSANARGAPAVSPATSFNARTNRTRLAPRRYPRRLCLRLYLCRTPREAFVAQMLNLDLLDGISFSKGCYTGQGNHRPHPTPGPHQKRRLYSAATLPHRRLGVSARPLHLERRPRRAPGRRLWFAAATASKHWRCSIQSPLSIRGMANRLSTPRSQPLHCRFLTPQV